jgi:hypothetical protein
MSVANGLDHKFLGVAGSGAGIATTAGGAEVFEIGANSIGLYIGSGAPTASGAKGSLYIRTDGSTTATRLYINSTGATAWVAITTAS